VIVEEKPAWEPIEDAIEELQDKFNSASSHYDEALEWIVGIAISGSRVVFGQLRLAFPRQTPAQFVRMGEFDLSTRQGQLGCARAAINIGRWVSWVNSSDLVHGTYVRFWESMDTYTLGYYSDVIISPTEVYKVLHSPMWERQSTTDAEAEERKRTVRSFYEEIATPNTEQDGGNIPYLEWATEVGTDERGDLTLRLQPVGVPRRPCGDQDPRDALRCVVTALSALHARGWVHLDVRWANIVWCGGKEWYLIDSEFSRKFGAKMPQNLVALDKDTQTADAAADMYLVGMLLCDAEVYRPWVRDMQVEALRDALCGSEGERVPREMQTAEWVLNHEYFKQ
jgi:hypothetical protein